MTNNNSNHLPKQLKCTLCQREFQFTTGEQEFFAAKGLMHEPRHCPDCRVLMRAQRKGELSNTAEVCCATCGAITLVPFLPKGHKPVYCASCYQEAKSNLRLLVQQNVQQAVQENTT